MGVGMGGGTPISRWASLASSAVRVGVRERSSAPQKTCAGLCRTSWWTDPPQKKKGMSRIWDVPEI